jgi:branched-chain amino acid transport system substrate-binding protein
MSSHTAFSRRATLAALGGTMLLPARAFAQASGKVLKLGSLCTLTGPSASIGKESIAGLNFGVKALNDAGGVQIGGDTYQVTLINVDDESRTERAVAGAERLIAEDKVSLMFMPPNSSGTLAILPLAERARIPAISFVSAAQPVTSPEYSFSFRSTLSSVMNVSPAVDFLVGTKGAKKLAFLGRNDDWGRTASAQIKAKAQELGASVVADEYFEVGSMDFYGLLTKIRAAGPDAVLIACYIEDGVSLMKQYRELQMKPMVMGLGVIWSSPTFMRSAGRTIEGIYLSTGPTTGESPELTAFGASLQKVTGHAALPYEITAYDNLMMVMAAMKKAGSIEGVKVRDAMRNFEYEGLLQRYRFGSTGQSEVKININEVRSNRPVVLTSVQAS